MDHEEVQSLLGAFALDAVEPEEAEAIRAHLRTCPRCQAEVEAYREVAAMLANTTGEAPEGAWERLVDRLGPEEGTPSFSNLRPHLSAPPGSRRGARRLLVGAAAALLAAAAVAVGLLWVRVDQLDSQLGRDRPAATGLSEAVAAALAGPHRTLVLTTADSHSRVATIALTPGGEAYWVSSSLPPLPAARTYQLWALVGGRAVSVGLVGADPRGPRAFYLEPAMTALMVTAEPSGGTPGPTTPVVASTLS